MHVKFKSIELHNFMSFGDANISLENSGFTLVSGINNRAEDNSKSNGSGKSSIWEAIIWALVGETMRGTNDIVHTLSEDGCWVRLKFSIDSDEYELLRSKDSKEYKTNLRILLNGEDKSGKGIKDSSKILADMLPDLTPALLGSVILLGQGLPQRFTNNTPSGRKEVLEKLSKSDFMIEDLKERLANRKLTLNNDIRFNEDALLEATTKQSMIQAKLNGDKLALSNLESIDNIKAEIQTLVSELEELTLTITDSNNKVDALNGELEKISNEKFDLASKRTTALDAELFDLKSQLSDIDSKISEYLTKKSLCESEIKRIESISDICPTCGQKLLGVEKPSTESLKVNLAELSSTLAGLSISRCSIVESIENKTRDINNQFESKLENLNNEYHEFSKAKTEYLTKCSSANSASKFKQNRLSECLNIENNYKFTKDNLIKAIQESESQLVELADKIMYINISKEKLVSSLDVITKMITIVTRDFRGFLLSNVIDYIDLKAKEYSIDVFNTDLVKFVLEGNNINIYYDNKVYENLSGGERQKIDLIIQFAMRDMLCKFLNFSSNIIVLDEIFDNLDALGCHKVLNLITNKLVDINNIFIVTHHAADLHIPYDNEIIVVKNEDGFSRIM